ncbi:MAG TPA: transposase, partial [Chloroflexota bacterium]|nr:transposase [Chloroflexota bacterium]
MAAFAPLSSRRVWGHAQVLLAGAILAPAQRTVAAALRVMGLDQIARFRRYHRVLGRARWSGLAAGRVLLRLLVAAFAPAGPLVVGVDETLERRRGKKIAPKGIYRDAVRSSREHFAKASGLRWVCLMLLVPIPWAARTWALPVLTALAPSERYDRERGRRHKALTDWARKLLLVVRRWWPDRPIVAVADSSYAALELLAACQAWAEPVTVITRLRLDAALYEPAPPRRPRQVGRPRLKGQRLPTLAGIAGDPTTSWTPITVPDWYGTGARSVEIVSDTAVWYHAGLPPVPVRWVLIRDPHGRFDTQALLC